MTISYKFLNQIFYTNNKFDDPTDLDLLEPFFMNLEKDLIKQIANDTPKSVIKDCCVDLFEPVPILSPRKEPENQLQTTIIPPVKIKGFSPRDRDAVFWCIFAHHYGEMEYEMIRSNYGKRKVDEKMAIYSWLKENRPLTKQYPSMKITNGLYQEMLSELMCVQSNTGFLSIIAFSLYYKINIYLVDKKKNIYLEFLGQVQAQAEAEAEDKCILYRLDRGYCLSNDTSISSMYKLESYMKPLKAISNWKMCELEEVIRGLGIWTDGLSSMKKPELYAFLADHCQWSSV